MPIRSFFAIAAGGRYVPHFEFLTEGFTSLKMVNRNQDSHGTPPPPSSKTPTHPYSWGESPNMQSTKTSGDSNTGKWLIPHILAVLHFSLQSHLFCNLILIPLLISCRL